MTVSMMHFAIYAVVTLFPSAMSMQSRLASFKSWVAAQNIVSKCEVSQDEHGGFRLIANEIIHVNEVFIRVPLSCCITSEVQGHSWMTSLDWPVRMALQLLSEVNNPNSNFKSYIDVLPNKDRFKSLPHHWSESAILHACYPELFEEYVKTRNFREASWNDVNALQSISKIDSMCNQKSDFEWALDCIMTRNIKVYRIDVGINVCVPFFDMMNHNSSVVTLFELNMDSKTIDVRYTEGPPTLKGEEVYLNYGHLNTCKALCDYGFIPINNPYDKVDLPINRTLYLSFLTEELSNRHVSIKKSPLTLLRDIGVDYAGTFEFYPDGVSPELVFALRVLLADTTELITLWATYERSPEELNRYIHGPITERNEKAVKEQLISMITTETNRLKDLHYGIGFNIPESALLIRMRNTRMSLLQSCILNSKLVA
jgi:hypothetical protein